MCQPYIDWEKVSEISLIPLGLQLLHLIHGHPLHLLHGWENFIGYNKFKIITICEKDFCW